MSVHEHKRHARANLKIGVITASDTRTPETDESGKLIRIMFEAAGHHVSYYEILPDEGDKIAAAIVNNLSNLHAVIVNGGTGVSSRDGSTEEVKALIDKELEGVAELLQTLSFKELGSPAIRD